VNAVYRQLQELLGREGVTAIEAVGEPFDPNLHNAVLRKRPPNTRKTASSRSCRRAMS
jgi:molecular chaperone GrpE